MVNKKIQILDCTLRDGGYCNQWKFGKDNIIKIIKGLINARIDIIECGFLTNRVEHNEGISKFSNLKQIEKIIPQKYQFVCMMNYGEYEVDKLPECDGNSVDGIRVAFHKKDVIPALEVCKQVKNKRYDVYIQAMVSMAYTEEEFIDLICRVNEIKPKAFYIVDSFGSMETKDLMCFFDLTERYLDTEILIGFHCHNNMQLAYANAQTFCSAQTKHDLIVDSSVMGMGRGAGNLNTELFVEYLNKNVQSDYILKPVLTLIDDVLNNFYYRNYWGYSLPNYLSAKHNIHPNYASYLMNKNTLTVTDLHNIFLRFNQTQKVEFDKVYIEKMYLQYMNKEDSNESNYFELEQKLKGRTVLVIGPGRSSELEKEKIVNYATKLDVVKISVNFDYPYVENDYIFISNLRRFEKIDQNKKHKMIVTSNIPIEDAFLKVRYQNLKNEIENVEDNAGMMLLRLLYLLGVKRVILAGIDGYSYDESLNYADENMQLITKREIIDKMNQGMQVLLHKYNKELELSFLTKSQFDL